MMRAAALGGAMALAAGLAAAAPLVGQDAPDGGLAAREAALDAAAGWRDALEAHRAPQLPTPGDTESVILLLADPPAADAAAAERAAAAAAIARAQERLAPVLADLGATVTFRYRMLVNAVGVRLPAGRLEALAALPEVRAVVPVTFLAPAQAGAGAPTGPAAGGPPPVAGAGGPAHLALIDGGIDAGHPWLGGGIGPTYPIVGGEDLVGRDGDPSAEPGEPGDVHGTQLAGLVLRSPALQGLPPERVPRLVAYRVIAREPVAGRLRPLARTDRVLAALERAVDPDGDGDPRDRAEVILMGLAAGFGGGGADPVSEALAAADRLGSTVVVPAGNDGPTFARPGAVGGPAAAPTAIAVGGAAPPGSARTATLEARIGPAAARLDPLPLGGAGPPPDPLPVRFAQGPSGLATGESPEHYAGEDGASRVAGALVVVARGEGSLAEKAAAARAAGAAALAVWDRPGPAAFPAVPGDPGLGLPVVGLGRRQGEALARLVAAQPDLRVTLLEGEGPERPAAVASFSSWGPTPAGLQKPDLVAPAVARTAPWPGRGPGGEARWAPLTGTSAAAAEVAARALRLRVDRPDLGPRAVHSILVQSARPLRGVAAERQGAGLLGHVEVPRLRVAPAIVAAAPGAPVLLGLGDLAGAAGRYRVELETPDETVTDLADAVEVPAGGRARVELTLPKGVVRGRIVVRDAATGESAATAPVLPARPAPTPEDALGAPRVRERSGLADVLVRVGLMRREDGRVRGARLHAVRLHLVPEGGGDPIPVAGSKQDGTWPAGTYRFLVARRLASGLEASPGTYRLRVTARGADGRVLRRESAPIALGE